jgi:hypothetical protein
VLRLPVDGKPNKPTWNQGMATDKVIALSGNATDRSMNLNLNIQPVDIAAQFEKLHAAIREKAMLTRTEEKAGMASQQLALPNSEINSDPGGETGFKAENRNG